MRIDFIPRGAKSKCKSGLHKLSYCNADTIEGMEK